jgi:hypothetical protein
LSAWGREVGLDIAKQIESAISLASPPTGL